MQQVSRILKLFAKQLELNDGSHVEMVLEGNKMIIYLFEVLIKGKKIEVAILSDQVNSLDWDIRDAEFIESIDKIILKKFEENIKL